MTKVVPCWLMSQKSSWMSPGGHEWEGARYGRKNGIHLLDNVTSPTCGSQVWALSQQHSRYVLSCQPNLIEIWILKIENRDRLEKLGAQGLVLVQSHLSCGVMVCFFPVAPFSHKWRNVDCKDSLSLVRLFLWTFGLQSGKQELSVPQSSK